MRRNRGRNCCNIGLLFAAFGLGMVIALICPKSIIVGILATALVILGIFIAK